MLSAQTRLQPLSGDSLKHLHRGAIESPEQIRAFLESLASTETVLANGVDHKSRTRSARVELVARAHVELGVDNIRFHPHEQIYFDFEFEGVGYFLVAAPQAECGSGRIQIRFPRAIYQSERRDMVRESIDTARAAADGRVEFRDRHGEILTAVLRDTSYQGLSLAVSRDVAEQIAFPLQLKFLDGSRAGESVYGDLKHKRDDDVERGWVRLGMAISRVPTRKLIAVERHHSLLGGGRRENTWRRISMAGAMAGAVARGGSTRIVRRLTGRAPSARVDVVEYANDRGQRMTAIVDSTGETRGAPAVVIPPAWGRTKETMLPLAMTLIRTFERAGEPLVVLRFDGTNRRGESYIDPHHRGAGDEYLGFRFSQAVADIEATLDFLENDDRFQTRDFGILTISMGAVEGRRAVAQDVRGRIKGWLSLVGMVDLQSGLRTVSGGVDYAYGLARGVHFGRHELVGVKADMDATGHDALDHRMVLFEDAKRDMEQIKIPVTWLHGRYDAWMEIGRVRRLLSAGDTSRRRLIEVPTGHQLRSSRQALETFQLATREVAAMLLGREIEPALPDLSKLEAHSNAERARMPKHDFDLRSFWSDYLLGRDRKLGIELMTATSAYRKLMSLQVERLALRPDDHIVDFGSGAGDFPLHLAETAPSDAGFHLTEVDFVTEALSRGRARLASHVHAPAVFASSQSVAANLDISDGRGVPLASGVADAALLSLLISYLSDAKALIAEVARTLRPGGRIVLSSLGRDADISKIYVDGIAELPPDRVRDLFGEDGMRKFAELQRWFLSDAAKLLDLEEEGRFRFFDGDELIELVEAAGFDDVQSELAFGDPPQAVVISGIRRG